MLTKLREFLKSDLLKNTSIYFFITFISKVIPFIIMPLMTVYLSPKEYGIAATYQMYVMLFTLVISFELNRYLDIYYFKVSKKEFEKYLSTVLSVILVSSGIGFIISLSVMQFIQIEAISFVWVITIPLIIIFKLTFIINNNLFRNEENPIAYGKYAIAETLIYTLGTLLLAYLYQSWTSKGYSFIFGMVLLGGFSYLRLKKDYGLKFYINCDILKKAVIYSAPFVFGLNLANIIFTNSDKVILKYFYDYSAVGIFAIALSFASIIGFVTSSFMKSWIPYFYKKLKNNDKYIDRQTFYIFIFLVIISIFVMYLIKLIMPYMIDKQYYYAVELMPYISLAYLFSIAEQLLLYYINFYEKTHVLYNVIYLSILSSVMLAYFMVEEFGIKGMAISMSVYFILKTIYYFMIVYKLRKKGE